MKHEYSFEDIYYKTAFLRRRVAYLADLSYYSVDDVKQDLRLAILEQQPNVSDFKELRKFLTAVLRKMINKNTIENKVIDDDIDIDRLGSEEIVEVGDSIDTEIIDKLKELLGEDDYDSMINYRSLAAAARDKNLNYNILQKRIQRKKNLSKQLLSL